MLYFVLGTDGKEYGPADLEELRQWIAEGRLDGQTRVRPENSPALRTAGEVAELRPLLSSLPVPGSPRPLRRSLARTGLVLGVLSLALGPITGIPGLICSLLARHRARTQPQTYGGAPMAMAGFVLSTLGMLLCVTIFPERLVKWSVGRGTSVLCRSNLEHINVGLGTWALEHGGYPFRVGTNQGGSLEYCEPNAAGADTNSYLHYRAAASHLRSPRTLACPGDKDVRPVNEFGKLGPANVSYLLYTSTNDLPQPRHGHILTVCPVHKFVLMTDGRIRQVSQPTARPRPSP